MAKTFSKTFSAHDMDAVSPPLGAKQMLNIFLKKSAEFLDGLVIETGLALDEATINRLKLALLEDFIEVHNDALKQAMVLPEDKEHVDKLLSKTK